MKTIFVQIAAYRDTELPHTIASCLEQARYPERLRFGVCWQHDDETSSDLDPYIDDQRFRIDRMHYSESQGCCWARNRTNQLYRDEDYTLQIDAHMRFAEDWDERLINMLESIEHNKPLLTTYPPPYVMKEGGIELKDHGIQRLKLKKLRLDLSTIQQGEKVKRADKPGKSPFLAAGYFFTLGQFCREVEYDPHIYFQGEEISLAARAFTHGYDLYYPHEDLVWHLYNHDSPLHWSDHKPVYQDMEKKAIERLEELFLGDHTRLGKYGLGDKRTLEQYENYADIRFGEVIERRRKGFPHLFNKTISLDTNELERHEDYEFWILSLLDKEERVIHRHDIHDPDILNFRKDKVTIEATTKGIPTYYRIWPKTSAGWGHKYTYPLEPNEETGKNMEKIYIALAAYCEPELGQTIENCINRAKHPDRLWFGVCLQYDNDGPKEIHEDCIDELVEKYNIRLVKYPYTSSKGGCWARNIVQSLYRNEAYTLQVDAHSRFVEHWDDILIRMMKELPSQKPLITGFPPLYYIREGVEEFTSADDLTRVPITKITRWSDDGWIHHPTDNLAEKTSMPRRTRVLSGAFVFTRGRWNIEVNQDPYFTYTGEEFALTLRSYTSGYDLFNPSQIVVWHRCHPEPNRKFINESGNDVLSQRYAEAVRRLKILLKGDPRQELAPFSLGRERTLNDYRIFSGLDCRTLTIHEDAREGVPPDPVTIRQSSTDDELVDLTIQLAGLDTLELQCESTHPILNELIAAVEANAGRQGDDPDPLMYLQFGDQEDHEVYFLQSRLLSLRIQPGVHGQNH
jgi:glycosyltransferase involved in cell wall biosynthesis